MKTRWIRFAASKDDLKQLMHGKEIAPVRINSKSLLLVYHNESYALCKNRCPHQGMSLAKASCEDGKIVCPWHHYGFDLKDGKGAGLYLDIYPIEFREDGVYAGFEYFSLF